MSTIGLLKHGFFNKAATTEAVFSFKENDFNLNQLNYEFSTIYQLVKSNVNSLNKESEIVLYCSWLCELLIRYYQCDYVASNLETLLVKKNDLEHLFDKNLILDTAKKHNSFLDFLAENIKNLLLNFIYSFKSSTKIRSYVSSLIANRSYWSYSRWLARTSILYLLSGPFAKFIKLFNKAFGFNSSPEHFLELLEKLKEFFAVLNYSLYALRILINLILIIKHLIIASLSEDLLLKKVLIQEIEKRAYLMMNDLAWGTVSFLTYHQQFFALPVKVIPRLCVSFLAVDILLFLVAWAYDEYLYQERFKQLNLQKSSASSPLELAIINRQIDIENDEMEALRAYYLFNIAAAILLVFAYGMTLICPVASGLVLLAILSMIGNAIYSSCEEYRQFQRAYRALKREELNGCLGEKRVLAQHDALMRGLTKEYEEIFNKLGQALIFNAGFMAFILATAAISWPIAVLITVSYLVYKIWDAYEKEQPKKANLSECGIYRLFGPEPIEELPQSKLPLSYNEFCFG